jgi:hypothetical protein
VRGTRAHNPMPSGRKAGAGWGRDSNYQATWVSPAGKASKEPSCIPDPALRGPGGKPLANGGAYRPTHVPHVPTIMDELDAAKLSWHIYADPCRNSTVNAQGLRTCTGSTHGGLYIWSVCPSFAGLLYTGQCSGKNDAAGNGLLPDTKFIPDAHGGDLPAFSLVIPYDGNVSWHNGHPVTSGDRPLRPVRMVRRPVPRWARHLHLTPAEENDPT